MAVAASLRGIAIRGIEKVYRTEILPHLQKCADEQLRFTHIISDGKMKNSITVKSVYGNHETLKELLKEDGFIVKYEKYYPRSHFCYYHGCKTSRDDIPGHVLKVGW